MADFCTRCTPRMWGEGVLPDINIQEVFNKLTEGSYAPVLCEGCGLSAIGKFKDNMLKLAMPNSSGTYEWLTEQEFNNLKTTI